ncbi:hypothetical protein SAMN05444267_1001121 [Chryseobacterium polytrichastri]|uniref:Uncharacterized protein n=1 Tax=Chryseobacterium polytrichastri TaxID=1302687 RepID=A0A1M6PUF0_9FLAO|nr:hypothetical protein SAMN05444267_1001121 [Chryseobacterium polytrichastri]
MIDDKFCMLYNVKYINEFLKKIIIFHLPSNTIENKLIYKNILTVNIC